MFLKTSSCQHGDPEEQTWRHANGPSVSRWYIMQLYHILQTETLKVFLIEKYGVKTYLLSKPRKKRFQHQLLWKRYRYPLLSVQKVLCSFDLGRPVFTDVHFLPKAKQMGAHTRKLVCTMHFARTHKKRPGRQKTRNDRIEIASIGTIESMTHVIRQGESIWRGSMS